MDLNDWQFWSCINQNQSGFIISVRIPLEITSANRSIQSTCHTEREGTIMGIIVAGTTQCSVRSVSNCSFYVSEYARLIMYLRRDILALIDETSRDELTTRNRSFFRSIIPRLYSSLPFEWASRFRSWKKTINRFLRFDREYRNSSRHPSRVNTCYLEGVSLFFAFLSSNEACSYRYQWIWSCRSTYPPMRNRSRYSSACYQWSVWYVVVDIFNRICSCRSIQPCMLSCPYPSYVNMDYSVLPFHIIFHYVQWPIEI